MYFKIQAPLTRDQLPNDAESLKDLVVEISSHYAQTVKYLLETIDELRGTIAKLNERVSILEKENAELKRENANLREENAALKVEIEILKSENASFKAEVEILKSENAVLRRFQYGQRSERKKKDQSEEANENNQSTQKGSSKNQKTRGYHPGRHPFSAYLPRQEVIHDLYPQEKICKDCGGFLSLIGSEDKEQLEAVIDKYIVMVHKRLKYACKYCQASVKLAPAPHEVVEKGIAGPNLAAQILVDKFGDHLPLYRQEHRFARSGIVLSRSTLWNLVKACGELLEPIYEEMKKDLLGLGHIFMDETPMPTLRARTRENKGKQAKKNYIWTSTGEDKINKAKNSEQGLVIVVYFYTQGRGSKHAKEFLEGYEGFLQVDEYSGYSPAIKASKNKIIRVGCWAHARRGFEKASVVNPESKAIEMMDLIGKLYELEREFQEKQLTIEQIKEERQQRSKPILTEIKQWLEENGPKVTPKSLLGRAIAYAQSHWGNLIVYTEDGRLEIDNNRSERCIKNVVIGRKNYLFVGSEVGGKIGSIIYSMIVSCILNGKDPERYLADVLLRISTHPQSKIKELLPYNWLDSKVHQRGQQAQAPPQAA